MSETTDTEVPTAQALAQNQARLVDKLQRAMLDMEGPVEWRVIREGLAGLAQAVDKLVSLTREHDDTPPPGDLSDRLTPVATSDPDSPGIPDARLQQILDGKDADEAHAACKQHGYSESWSIIDGALVIFDFDNPPAWLKPVLDARDDDGNTPLASTEP